MKEIGYLFVAFKRVLLELNKGKFLVFFLPSVLITLIFNLLFSYSYLEEIELNSFYSILKSIINQLYLFFILTILSPINTIVSTKLDQQITGIIYKSGISVFIRDFIRMMFVVLIAILVEIILMGIFWSLSYVFGFSFLDEGVFYIISSFFFGYSFYDYSLERHGLNVFSSFSFSFKNPLRMILAGGLFLLISSIPLVGIILAPIILTMMTTIVYLYSTKKIS